MKFIEQVVLQLFGSEASELSLDPIVGGCIHQAGCFTWKGDKYFIKWNTGASHMFETEAMGLAILEESSALEVPHLVGHGSIENTDYLCLNFVEKGTPKGNFWQGFGSALAQLHCCTASQYGLNHDNYIGSLVQSNNMTSDWISFFIQQRLKPMLKMAHNKGFVDEKLIKQFDALFTKLDQLIPRESPALMHGDLWSGNFLIGAKGAPVVFDPAVYYGHREAEMAFTRMFGGFDADFYDAYQEAYPLQSGHEERVDLFNLYPLIVHLNLFGTAYLSGIQKTLARYI